MSNPDCMDDMKASAQETAMAEIIAENGRRNQLLVAAERYNPVTGEGCCGQRCLVRESPFNDGEARVPKSMLADKDFDSVTSVGDWVKLRCRHDFEYWAYKCVRIRDKISGKMIPFRLNSPQRKITAILEADRLACRPLRLIILKARQWGGSTLVQMYMAWIQTCLRRNWHSVICAHLKDSSANIRGMYDNMLRRYPKEYWQGDEPPRFRPFENTSNTRIISGRDCRVTIGTSMSPESVRGADIAMAHLSEVAFWKDTAHYSAESVVRSIGGTVALIPLSLLVMESTANGYGNFFHDEWLRAKAGKSDKHPVFIPWYEISIYSLPVDNYEQLWESLDDYERRLWTMGITLEKIKWYHEKRREYPDITMMHAEYPTDETEAFVSTSSNVFSTDNVNEMSGDCTPGMRGDIVGNAPTGGAALENVRFVLSDKGELELWRLPEADSRSDRYMVVVDVGGRSDRSDFSVVSVFDRLPSLYPDRSLEVVAQWRGHTDKDLLLWKAAAIASFYNNALLVIESNSLETSEVAPIEIIVDFYKNIYRRVDCSKASRSVSAHFGFHTNRDTKPKVIATLIAAVREHSYTERSAIACKELSTYTHNNGKFEAGKGNHDDVLMTRAIALFVNTNMPPVMPDAQSDNLSNDSSLFYL